MGPRATASFLEKLISLTPAKKDWEHIHVVVDNNPQIPSRTRHYLFDEESPVPFMIEGCNKLASWPVDIIAVPCNSACYFLPDVQREVPVPIVNIMEVTSDFLAKSYPGIKRCVVLGGRITYAEKTYRPYLEKNGIEYADHGESLQKKVEEAIEDLKINSYSKKSLDIYRGIIDELRDTTRAESVILGCTEFGCIYNAIKRGKDREEIKIVDSSETLALHLIQYMNE